jgi:hypothetical protein
MIVSIPKGCHDYRNKHHTALQRVTLKHIFHSADTHHIIQNTILPQRPFRLLPLTPGLPPRAVHILPLQGNSSYQVRNDVLVVPHIPRKSRRDVMILEINIKPGDAHPVEGDTIKHETIICCMLRSTAPNIFLRLKGFLFLHLTVLGLFPKPSQASRKCLYHQNKPDFSEYA